MVKHIVAMAKAVPQRSFDGIVKISIALVSWSVAVMVLIILLQMNMLHLIWFVVLQTVLVLVFDDLQVLQAVA